MKASILCRKAPGLFLLTIVLFFGLLRGAFAQSAPITGDQFACQDEVKSYSFTTTPNCPIEWFVTEGVFPDDNNSTRVSKTANASGVTTINVKWTGKETASLSANGCTTSDPKTIYVDYIPFTVIATPATINFGQQVLLTAVPAVPITPTYAWTATPTTVSHLLGTTGPSVAAAPTAKSTYFCQASYTFTTGVNQQTCTKTNSVVVNVNVPPITGNVICCSQCITPSQTPAPLGPAAGAVIGGGNNTPYTYQWYSSTNGVNFVPISNQTSPTYSPGVLHQTMWYKRTVGATEVAPVSSNVIRIDAPPPTLAVSAATYATSKVFAARETISILGDLEPAADVEVEFRAGEQIIVQAESILYPGITLYAGFSCDAAARLGSSTTTTADVEVPEAQAEYGSALSIYPNPSHGETTVRYAVAKRGYARITLTDSRGVPVSTLVNEQDVAPGDYSVTFGTHTLRPGLYFCILRTASSHEVKRISVRSN